MRACIDYAFRIWYHDQLSRWALSLQFPEAASRTHVACYEDLVSDNRYSTVRELLEFYFSNGTLPYRYIVPSRRETQEYTGGHSTSHDADLRNHLKAVIKELDAKYYNGEIAWLDEIWPCHESTTTTTAPVKT